MVLPSSSTSRIAPALKSSVKLRRGRFGLFPSSIVDTVSAFRSVSTKPGEAQFAKGQKQERTEWHRIVTWGRTAAACAQHLDVGHQVLVRGRLRTRSWPDRHAVQRWSTEVLADRVIFLGGAAKRTSEPTEQLEPPPPED